MTETLAGQWATARTLEQLGALTADWLEGTLPGDHPNGYDRPDEETLALVSSLATACRAGFVTLNSQPGCMETVEGQLWTQWAWVDGLADADLCGQIYSLARAHGLLVVTCQADDPVSPEPYTVVTVDGNVCGPDGYAYGQIGARAEREDVEIGWEDCHPDAVAAALAAWQVTLVDPEPGRNDRLWKVLDQLSGKNAA